MFSVKVFLFLSERRLCPKQWRNFTGFCFFFKQALVLTKPQAKELCQDQNGSNLVDIQSKLENNFVGGLLKEVNVSRRLAFLGIELSKEGLKWDRDGMNVTYSNWAKVSGLYREPAGIEKCGVIGPEGFWFSTQCIFGSTWFPIIVCKKGNWLSCGKSQLLGR